MLERVRYVFVWLSRIFHCRGFGVQSPTDYRFVRYVINEHWPYYKYSEIGQGDCWQTRHVGRLCFRLANWLQPKIVTATAYQEYIQAGCGRCRLVDDSVEVDMAVVSSGKDVDRVLSKCRERSLLVLDRLYQQPALWQRIVEEPVVTVTYDLYYCGIALFDPKRAKKHYKVNF